MYMLMEQIMPLFVFFMFGVVLFAIGKNIVTWHQNNQAPRLTVQAKVVSKRQNTMRSSATVAGDLNGGCHTTPTTTTSYYVTFQVESGDRMELLMPGSEYGMIAEGDEGKLTFQGTRFLGFERMY